MSSHVFYRKYRPHSFEDVIGQEHIRSVLEAAVREKTIGHAYLFSGARGTGKTTMARIFASEVGATERDLYEIDAASNRGVDDIRALREEVHTLPFESPHKVYLIDEVHMLTKEAFNALLKTLEEPPEHVIFILATTELEKLPETVVSRCQTFSFKQPSVATLKEMVTRVAHKEGYKLDAPAAELVALLADGSFRDAHGILQKVVTAAEGKQVSRENVERITGAPKGELLLELLVAVAEQDLARALKCVSDATGQSDMKMFVKLLLRLMRAILLLRHAPDMKAPLAGELSEREHEVVEELAGKKGTALTASFLRELLEAYTLTGTSAIAELPLELVLINVLGTTTEEL